MKEGSGGLVPVVAEEDGIMTPGEELGVIPHWSFREGSNEETSSNSVHLMSSRNLARVAMMTVCLHVCTFPSSKAGNYLARQFAFDRQLYT